MSPGGATIRTPDRRLRVFVSSTLGELAPERAAVRAAIEGLRLTPVMFELGARPHPPRDLYRAYLSQSDVFVGLYAERYGWVAPGEEVSGLEDEYRLAGGMPRLVYIREPAPGREERLARLLADVKDDDSLSYRRFATADELQALVADDLALLLSERFESSGGAPEAVASPQARTRLPVPLTETVGRDSDLGAVLARLRAGARLVTLTGPGGVGKTRLSLAVGHAAEADFPDGVRLVPLAAVTDPALVMATVAERLGLRVEGTLSAQEAVAHQLGRGRTLLLLDNLEQVAAAGSEISEALAACPRTAVLATSRRALRVGGEQEYVLGPLELPGESASPETIAAAASVRLLLDRAHDAGASLDMTPETAGAVAALCRRLDGLPLALELAAARLRLVPPREMVSRLGDRLDVLAGRSDLPSRQQTLRATVDWSFQLLREPEQAAFARFSVFAGGATLDAGEAVAGLGNQSVAVLSRLLDDSMLTNTMDPANGETRLAMLETLRAYASERLAERGEVGIARGSHLDYFYGLGRQAQPFLCGPQQRDWAARLDPERANVRTAVETGFATGRLDRALQIVWDTIVYYYIRDAFQEPRGWVAQLRNRRSELDEPRNAVLDVALALGDEEADPARLMASILLLEREGYTLEPAVGRFSLGLLAWRAGDLDGCVAELCRASGGYLAIDHDWGVATTETTLGEVLTTSRPDRAWEHQEKALFHAARIDNRPLVTQALQGLALLDVLAGRPGAALGRLREAAALARGERWASGASYALDSAAVLAHRLGLQEVAVRAHAGAEEVRARLGTPAWTPAGASVAVVAPDLATAQPRSGADPIDTFDLLDETLLALEPALGA